MKKDLSEAEKIVYEADIKIKELQEEFARRMKLFEGEKEWVL